MQGGLSKSGKEELAVTKYCVECGKEMNISYKNICMKCHIKEHD